MGASAITWMKMRPNKFSELSWKNKSSYSLVKLESPTLADYLWKKETKKLGSVICNGHIYQVKYQKFRVEGDDDYEDVIPLDGVVEGCVMPHHESTWKMKSQESWTNFYSGEKGDRGRS